MYVGTNKIQNCQKSILNKLNLWGFICLLHLFGVASYKLEYNFCVNYKIKINSVVAVDKLGLNNHLLGKRVPS